jgi:hypothetical protein
MPRINNPKPPKRAPKIDTRRGAKKKPCSFCQHGVDTVDYKDLAQLRKYISDRANSTNATSPMPLRPLVNSRCCPIRSAR